LNSNVKSPKITPNSLLIDCRCHCREIRVSVSQASKEMCSTSEGKERGMHSKQGLEWMEWTSVYSQW